LQEGARFDMAWLSMQEKGLEGHTLMCTERITCVMKAVLGVWVGVRGKGLIPMELRR